MPDSIYRIRHISKSSPEEGKIYLFDTNVWILVLRPPEDLNPFEKNYVDFFDAVINLSMNDRCKNKPSIFMNEPLFSEVYNAFMNVNWRVYLNTVSTACTNLKLYRATEDFKKQLKNIKSDFEGYKPFLLTDIPSKQDPLRVLLELPENTDYNDNLYFRIAREHNMTIVTNDADFDYLDVEILTSQPKLLSRMRV